MDHHDLYLNSLLPHIFVWTFMLHCLRGQTREISVQIHCQYVDVAATAGPWQPARPNPQETGFHAYHTFAIWPRQYYTFWLTNHIFLWIYHRKFALYMQKKPLLSMTEELVNRLYSTVIQLQKPVILLKISSLIRYIARPKNWSEGYTTVLYNSVTQPFFCPISCYIAGVKKIPANAI